MGPSEQGVFVQGSFRANLAYVGLPIVFSAVGQAGLRKAGIFLGFIVPLLNALAVVALMRPARSRRGRGSGPRPDGSCGRSRPTRSSWRAWPTSRGAC